MEGVKRYHLPPTPLIPNSPHPLVHYPSILQQLDVAPHAPEQLFDLFARNGWQTQWMFRYGQTQDSHYHSKTHEAMAVLAGTATIRFGVADAEASNGIEVSAKAGDVFVLPAGVAHKTFDTAPPNSFTLLTPGNGHADSGQHDIRAALAQLSVEDQQGFVMMGAYPAGSETWNFAIGGELSREEYNKVWAVPRPEKDPVLGLATEGICGLWKDER